MHPELARDVVDDRHVAIIVPAQGGSDGVVVQIPWAVQGRI